MSKSTQFPHCAYITKHFSLTPFLFFRYHYTIHYIDRGAWDNVPFRDTEVCCAKTYFNKNDYLIHLATYHGYLFEALLSDEKVDMMETLINLVRFDKSFYEYYESLRLE